MPDRTEVRSPFHLPTGGYGYPAAVHHVTRRSIRAVLPYFGFDLDEFGTTLVDRWDAEADEMYLLAARAIGGWVDYVLALPMPILIPEGELRRPRTPSDPAFIEMQHHAYFEATLALGDSLSAGLAGHPRAALATLRSFVECALAEVWVHGDREGRRLWDYLRYLAGAGHRPRYRQMLDAIFEEPRFAAIGSFRQQVEALYGSASSGAHVQTPDEGLLHMRDGNRAVATYPELVYWLAFLGMAVQRMLTLLVLRFPMALFPVDVRRRFAFAGPMGLFADEIISASVREGLGVRHVEALASFLKNDDEVISLLEYFATQPVLTDAQIDQDWARFASTQFESERLADVPPDGRWAAAKAHIASLQWALDMALAVRLIPDEPDLDPDGLLRRSILAAELRSHYRHPDRQS